MEPTTSPHANRGTAPIPWALCTFCVFVSFLGTADSAKILCIFPTPSRSHVIIGQNLLKGLAERGHQVTMVSAFKLPKPVKNYREVTIPGEDYASELTKKFLLGVNNPLKTLPVMMQKTMESANNTINHPQFLELKKEKFDLVIVGIFVVDYVLGLGPHFDAPTVAIWSSGLSKITADLVGNPRSISTVPSAMLGRQDSMSFMPRLKNFLVSMAENVFVLFSTYKQRVYYNWNFPSDRYPSYDDVRKNVSLLLLNTHYSQAGPRPYLPNVVEVGGLQIKAKPDLLPRDIQEWLDGAEHGAVYFCLGSNLKSTDLPAEKLEVFVKSLGKLKQRVLWKWESGSIPNQPSNVMTQKWLPQDDILAHKNVVLFISHGGLGGMAEARYHGVPVLGIPIFAEQSGNVIGMVREGLGLGVDYATLAEKSFTESLNEVLTNSRFRQKAKETSVIYRDRPQTALDLACYWVEYVIRHKGAPHLHYQGAELNFIQKQMLDVIVVLLLGAYVVFKILKFLVVGIRKLIRRIQRKQKLN
ncbi:UDP-glucosyltransferase 2-like [Toxorhynchites rutilus septentrionalis]|uniref:UDP-glucosyltransferase 2-like n=1 Tax=Toxorhynchites rutilus septentrionalis TaxID=329112 RepID=UPI0024797F76|nr:UDP-glucosyltransferase 2-like [Toxorhynchites rutilus septentrionalis]